VHSGQPNLALLPFEGDVMLRRYLLFAGLCVLLARSAVAADDVAAKDALHKWEGTIIKVDPEKREITITMLIPVLVNGEKDTVEGESKFAVPKDAKIVDPKGKEIKEGIKTEKLKPGIKVVITGKPDKDGPIVRQVKVLQEKE
jgi:hypothetical protein